MTARPESVTARRPRLWWLFLLGGLVGIVLHQLAPPGIARDLVYLAFGPAAAAAIVVGVRLHRPAAPAGWYLMAAGLVLWALGDGVSSWIADVQHADRFPTVADVCYLLGYPVVVAGLFGLIRARRPLRDAAGILDSAILTVGLGLLVWILVVVPTVADHHDSWSTAVVVVAYPVVDILLLGQLMGLLTTPGGRTTSFRLLATAVVVLIAVDLAAAALDRLTFGSTRSLDFCWLTSYALWGAAALHPSMAELSQRTATASTAVTAKRLAALTSAVVVAPVALVVQHRLGVRTDVWAIAVGAAVTGVLVLASMKVAFDRLAAADRARHRAQEALAHQATHDALTGLPNRAQALELVDRALGRAGRRGEVLAVLFLDLDGFKHVNDTLGHAAGDELLRVVAERLRQGVRSGDVACRLGGDEFVVVLDAVTDEREAVAVAERLRGVLSEPVLLPGGQEATVGASIGVATSRGGTSSGDLLHEADVAVYRAKRSGGRRVVVLDASLRRELDSRAELERDLAAAIRGGGLVLHYQPIVHLASGAVTGYEALVRWPRDGVLLSPADFIGVAEQSELICELGAHVLSVAAAVLARWNERTGDRSSSMAVNLSARHISRPRVLADVRRAVAEAGIDSAQLVLEITETALIDGSRGVANLTTLRSEGSTISIDDFGTGYSSIARLEHLPVDVLKIDQRFLQGGSRTAETLLRMIVQTGHALGLRVIAEGVETPEQASLLRSIGCESAQGYLFGRPVALAEIDGAREPGPAPADRVPVRVAP